MTKGDVYLFLDFIHGKTEPKSRLVRWLVFIWPLWEKAMEKPHQNWSVPDGCGNRQGLDIHFTKLAFISKREDLHAVTNCSTTFCQFVLLPKLDEPSSNSKSVPYENIRIQTKGQSATSRTEAKTQSRHLRYSGHKEPCGRRYYT